MPEEPKTCPRCEGTGHEPAAWPHKVPYPLINSCGAYMQLLIVDPTVTPERRVLVLGPFKRNVAEKTFEKNYRLMEKRGRLLAKVLKTNLCCGG